MGLSFCFVKSLLSHWAKPWKQHERNKLGLLSWTETWYNIDVENIYSPQTHVQFHQSCFDNDSNNVLLVVGVVLVVVRLLLLPLCEFATPTQNFYTLHLFHSYELSLFFQQEETYSKKRKWECNKNKFNTVTIKRTTYFKYKFDIWHSSNTMTYYIICL